mmetsp:Transcript_6864/g.25313  ORF Transcript_6864/g.25313 Transcript_6864/m.25313 type:complete len:136 (-) Transcript_6864:171-578(-)
MGVAACCGPCIKAGSICFDVPCCPYCYMGWSIVAGVFCFVLGYLVSIDYDYLGEWYDADLRIDNPGESCRGSADNTDCVLFSETQDDATSAAYAAGGVYLAFALVSLTIAIYNYTRRRTVRVVTRYSSFSDFDEG